MTNTLVRKLVPVVVMIMALMHCCSPARGQCIRDQLFIENPVDTSLFGTSIAMDSDVLVVGAMLDTGAEWGSGRVHVYRREGVLWDPAQIIVAPDGDLTDMLGSSVELHDGTLIAGAWWDEENGVRSGSAYVFEENVDGTFVFVSKLLASDGMPEATFGRAVAVSGDFAVVGAPLQSTVGSVAGSAYLYERVADGWIQTAQILPEDLAAGDRFGISVDMDGTMVAIGSSWADSERGRVDLFEVGTGGSVLQVDSLQPAAIDPGDQFGFDVALDGDALLVGAYLDDELDVDGGSVWFYGNTPAGWSLEQGPVAEGSLGPGAQRGVSVDLKGYQALVGARYGASAFGAPRSGMAITYLQFEFGWEPFAYLSAAEAQTESEFGWGVALDGSSDRYGAVSAPYADVSIEDDGIAFVFDFNNEFCGGNKIGDINGDGIVDGADLTILLGSWGVCAADFCAADINQDGFIDGEDLTLLLGNWSS